MDPNEQKQFNNQFNGQFNGFDNGQFGGFDGNQFGGFNNQFGSFDNGQFNDFGNQQTNFSNQPVNNFDDMNYLDDLIVDDTQDFSLDLNQPFSGDFSMNSFQQNDIQTNNINNYQPNNFQPSSFQVTAPVNNYSVVQQKNIEEPKRNIFLGTEETTDRIAENLVEENVNAKDYKRGKNQRAEIKSIIKIYCLIIIVFAITLIGKSAYAMIMNKTKQSDYVTVHAMQMNAEVTLTFNANNPISKIVYSWDNNGSSYVSGDGRNNFKKTIEIPYGNPVLTVRVYDCYETEHVYTKTYVNTNADQTKPKIEVAAAPKAIQITATDDYGIKAIMYNWVGKEPVYISAEDDEKTLMTTVEITESVSDTLTITAIDVNNNQTTIEQKVEASHKPVITFSMKDKSLIIKAKDDVGITNIKVVADDQVADQAVENLKELSATLPLTTGNHVIKVTVTNANGLTTTEEGTLKVTD